MTNRFIIWELDQSNTLICFYDSFSQLSSQTLPLLTDLSTYLITTYNNKDLQNLYEILIKTNKIQTYTHHDTIIQLTHIKNNLYAENHYPKNNNYLLYAVNNKLKDPINNIVTALSVIDSNPTINNHDTSNTTEQENRECLDIIKEASYNIISTANDLIDVINLSNEKVNLDLKKTNILQIITDSYKLVSSNIKKKKLYFNYKISEAIPKNIIVDLDRVSQIIVNLIDNAINATKYGAITLEVLLFTPELHQETKSIFTYHDNCLLFKLKDTGIGINPDLIDFINNVLNINSNINLNTENLNIGIGLTICRYLTDLISGDIWYKTDKDIGTIFYFTCLLN